MKNMHPLEIIKNNQSKPINRTAKKVTGMWDSEAKKRGKKKKKFKKTTR